MGVIRESWRSCFNPILYPVRAGIFLLLVGSFWIIVRVYVVSLLVPVNAYQLQPGKAIRVTIPSGASSREIGSLLYARGLIKSKSFFVFYTRLKGLDKKLQAGEYCLSNTWTLAQILDVIARGRVILCKVTIPEGYTLAQISKLLVEKGIVEQMSFQKALVSEDYLYSFLADSPPGPRRLEGFLFPATYKFRAGLTGKEIVDLILKRLSLSVTPDFLFEPMARIQ